MTSTAKTNHDSSKRPYISFVIPTRNDNYAGGMQERLNFSLKILLAQLERAKIDSEIIVVDWNCADDMPPLKQVLDLSYAQERCSISVVEVPKHIHKRYRYSEKKPIHSALSANVGIRRARGEYIVLRMSDVIYSQSLIDFIATKPFHKNKFYRCDRAEVKNEVLDLPGKDIDQILEFCSQNIIQRNHYNHKSYAPDLPPLYTASAGDFQLLPFEAWHDIRGYYEFDEVFCLDLDGMLCFAAHASGLEQIVLEPNSCVYKIDHGFKNRQRIQSKKTWIESLFCREWVPEVIKQKVRALSLKVYGPQNRIVFGEEYPPREKLYYALIRNWVHKKSSYRVNKNNWGLTDDDDVGFYKLHNAFWESGFDKKVCNE